MESKLGKAKEGGVGKKVVVVDAKVNNKSELCLRLI